LKDAEALVDSILGIRPYMTTLLTKPTHGLPAVTAGTYSATDRTVSADNFHVFHSREINRGAGVTLSRPALYRAVDMEEHLVGQGLADR